TITITGDGTTGRFVIPESPIQRQIDIVTMLLDRGANINCSAEGDANRTPLHYAIQTGSKDLVALLLSRGADPKAKVRLSGKEFTAADLAKELKREDLLTLFQSNSSK